MPQTPTAATRAPAAVRTEARIRLDAISANVRLLRARTTAEVMAVVKADGYGHGMVASARAALAGGAHWLGVAFLEEALQLRDAGLRGPVLCWLMVPGERLEDGVRRRVDLSVGSPWALAEVETAALRAGRRARVHLEVDSGMGRGGALPESWPALVVAAAAARAAGTVEIVGIWSHLACADIPGHPATPRQLAAFRAALQAAAQAGVRPPLRHLAGSAALLTLPESHYDLVRPGIAVYGLSPLPAVATFGLTPALSLRSRVSAVVGPGGGPRRAVVPVGLADGVPAAAADRAAVQIRGRRHRVLSPVLADSFAVEVDRADVAPRRRGGALRPGRWRRADRAGLGRGRRHHLQRGPGPNGRPGDTHLPGRRRGGSVTGAAGAEPAPPGGGVATDPLYGEILSLGRLLALQPRLSGEHDELFFFVAHQVHELWFKVLLFELEVARDGLSGGDIPVALHGLRRVAVIEQVLVQTIGSLETITPAGFLRLRAALTSSSGFQSAQFREIEFLSGRKDPGYLDRVRVTAEERERLRHRLVEPTVWDGFVALLRRHSVADLPALLRGEAGTTELRSVAEALADHDESFSLWRSRHVHMVERVIGHRPGTGGSSGTSYLRSTQDKRFFPALWEARSLL